MDVLVTGGTGFIGSHLCAELAERDHDVTALSRDGDTAGLPDGVTGVAGDVTDYASIVDAFEGQDAVVHLVALSPLFEPAGGNAMHDRLHVGGTENVLAAAQEHDVGRFVHMSALGADADGSTAYIRAKGRAERAVMDSDRDWVVFRPSVVYGDGGEFVPFAKKLTTPYLTGLPGGGKTPFQPIWVGDLVPMLADAAEDDAHVGEAYDIGGPEVLTLGDVVRKAYRAAGKSVTILPIPMPLAKLGLSLAGPLPFVPFSADQARALQLDNRVADNDVTAFGVDAEELQTLDEYLGLA
jgi:uncharacterized protein YbjT (DUF2867 family)